MTPVLKEDEYSEGILKSINELVALRFKEPGRVQFEFHRLAKSIEASEDELPSFQYNVLLGMNSGVGYRPGDVHKYFSKACKSHDDSNVRRQYAKSLINCFEMSDALEQSLIAYQFNDQEPDTYHLIYETYFYTGRLVSALKWLEKYSVAMKKESSSLIQLRGLASIMGPVNEDDLALYIGAARKFLSSRNIQVHAQGFVDLSIDGSLLEVSIKTNQSLDDSISNYFDFLMSDYLAEVPSDVLKLATIRFMPYAS